MARKFKAVLPAASIQDLTVVTYNILADKYAMGGHHAYCPKEHLEWSSARMPRLIDEISSYQADILCLQEVERPFMEDELGPKLRSLGHEWLYYGKLRKPTDPVPGNEDGVCLSYNTSRLEKLASIKIRFSDYATKTFLKPLATKVKLTPPLEKSLSNFLDFIKEKEDGAILALLRDKQANQLVLAASTHIYWDPRHPDIKAAQATLLCAAIREFLETQSTIIPRSSSTAKAELIVTKKFKRHNASSVPVIIGGDFNSLPIKRCSDAFDEVPSGGECVSGVYELMIKGAIETGHQDHPAERRKEKRPHGGSSSGGGGLLKYLELTSKGFEFASAGKEAWGNEPLFTNRTPGFTGCLDYIFFSSKAFQVSEILEMPFGGGVDGSGKGELKGEDAEDIIEKFEPIPNAVWPSDHLAIGTKLRWKTSE